MLLHRSSPGFTLIELLIVVAIIGILAAVAIPNFVQAQIRGKVARVVSDLRTEALALETYCVDHGHYPPSGVAGDTVLIMPPLARLTPLTTPIEYLSTVPIDPFKELENVKIPECQIKNLSYRYRENVGFELVNGPWPLRPYNWELNSFGPDTDCDGGMLVVQYDPSNGTVSNGDISRCGP